MEEGPNIPPQTLRRLIMSKLTIARIICILGMLFSGTLVNILWKASILHTNPLISFGGFASVIVMALAFIWFSYILVVELIA